MVHANNSALLLSLGYNLSMDYFYGNRGNNDVTVQYGVHALAYDLGGDFSVLAFMVGSGRVLKCKCAF
jgi:hypothetical protein